MASVETLRVLGNEYNAEILEATDEPRSAQELSEELDIPIATCYRRIDELEEVDLLELHDRPLSDAHRRINVYRRNIDEIRAEFNESALVVEVQERTDIKNKLDDVWRTLSDTS
jgi:predicted transcriptional regulator